MDTTNGAAGKPVPGDDRANTLRGNLFILTATILFGINLPVLKILIPDWLTAMDATAVRIGGGALLMWIASIFVKNRPIDKSDWGRIIIGGAVGLFAFLYLFCLSLRYGSPIDVSIIMTTPPLFVIIFGVLFLHRRLSAQGIIGSLIALGGAAMIILSESGSGQHAADSLKGNLIALASAACYAFYLIIIEGPSHKYSTVTLMRWVFGCAAIVAIPLYFSLPEAPLFIHPQTAPVLWTLFIIAGPTFAAYLLVTPAIKMIGSKMVSMYQYLVPVVATVAAVILGIDHLKWQQPVAIIIIVAGMMLTQRDKH